MLDRLDAAKHPGDMNLPGYRKGTCAVWVSGNWRLTFRFDGEHAIDLNLEDYH